MSKNDYIIVRRFNIKKYFNISEIDYNKIYTFRIGKGENIMKKPIVVKEENKQRIDKILDELQKRCTVRIISAQNIIDACKRLDKFIHARSKKDLKGTIALIDLNAQHFANAYKYVPYSTQFEVEHMGSYWRLNWIKRDPVSYTRTTHITLSDSAKYTVTDYYTSCDIC